MRHKKNTISPNYFKEFECHKCGGIMVGAYIIEDDNEKPKCPYCIIPIDLCTRSEDERLSIVTNCYNHGNSDQKYLEKQLGYEVDTEAFKNRIKIQKIKREQKDAEYQKMRTQTNKKEINIPKCPTCSSTNISNISGLKRWVTTGLLGLASGDLGKTMQCHNCGYKW